MKKSRILSLLIAASASISAIASPEFIAHRFEIFKSAPISEGEIIFLGNSITNFHNWNEAFARPEGAALGESLIGNRGVSDGRAYQWKENVQVILDGPVKPKKLFICIGTNDLNLNIAPATVANDIRAIVRHVQVAAPETEIYLETIPPRSGATNARVNICNALLEPIAAEMGVNFINTTETLKNLPSGGQWSHDGLHPKGHGYRVWSQYIAPQVGLDCMYGDGTQVNGPLTGCVPVVRANQFSIMPVEEDDILVVGDAWGDGVLWHELVGNHNVKNRSTGSGNLSFDQAKTWLNLSLTHSPEIQKTPRAIVLAWGINEVYSSGFNADTYKQHVLDLADYAKQLAPGTDIILCQVPPLNAASATPVATANAKLAEITEYPVVDIAEAGYTGSVWSQGADASLNLKAQGALWVAKALAKTLNAKYGNGTATTPEQSDFEAYYANRNLRIDIARAYNSLYQRAYVRNSTAGAAALKQLEDGYLGLTKTFTADDVVAAQQLAATTLAAVPFALDETKTYRITVSNTSESKTNRCGLSLTVDGTTLGSVNADPTSSLGRDLWEITSRGDGTFNIRNPRSEQYIVPGSTLTLSATAPANGWTITPTDYRSGSYYNIYCPEQNCQLHILVGGNVTNYGYSNGAPNKTDGGCAFDIIEYTGTTIDPMHAPVESGWYEIRSRQTGKYVVTVDKVYRQTAANSYSLKYTVDAPADETRSWIYIDVQGSNTYFRASNGFYVCGNCVNSLNGENLYSGGTPGLVVNNGEYIMQRWAEWSGLANDPLNTESPYIGASGTSAERIHDFTRVNDVRLNGYDLWTVTINANNPTNEFRDHTHMTYNGITVYNGGTLFLAKGTVPAEADITVTAAEGVEQELDSPIITIDAAAKTITVSYVPVLTSGWRTMAIEQYIGTRSDVAGWTNTVLGDGRNHLVVADAYMPQTGQQRRYHIMMAEVDEQKPAAAFFNVEVAGNTVKVRTINGHYISGAGSGVRNEYAAPAATTDHPMKRNIAWVAWNASNLTNKPTDNTYALGQFGTEQSTFVFANAPVDDYDVYTVNILGETLASSLENDVQITYVGEGNVGIPSVYNGGTFFIAKGTPVSTDSFTVPEHGGNSRPLMTLSHNVLTVDYSQVQTSVEELSTVHCPLPTELYDLQGRRIAKPVKGLYIQNGKVKIN
ncbi:MAG: GDSL-type esterase/lipase family protein [Bacteroides sp.]|nr:GDSL-type esterase/lipase family protein [Bacteroides sp.]MCM1380139.1 GDSL-type esterase/lipase family protein [Bacteroides sp.]MCM1445739.1 GDSL-type esterase/lipase family protein [Prevotella sp.]